MGSRQFLLKNVLYVSVHLCFTVFFSKKVPFLYSWVWPIYITGHKRDLQFSDLFRCPQNDVANIVGDKLER